MEISQGVGPVNEEMRSFFEKVVVPLVVIEDDQIIGIGTGTLISSTGVLLLAKHVVLEAHARGVDRVGEDGKTYRDYNLSALIRTGEAHAEQPDQEIGGLLPIVQVWLDETFDVGFALLQQMQEPTSGRHLEHNNMHLNLVLPQVGQRVIALGYQGVKGTISDGTCDYHDELYSSDGVVTEVFNERRDSVLLNFPSFHVEGDFRPAMSGGPILFDGLAGIPAIVCSGSDAGYATGAMVWPSMGIEVDWGGIVTFPDMLTFAKQGYVSAEGLDRVEVEHLGNHRSSVRYVMKGPMAGGASPPAPP